MAEQDLSFVEILRTVAAGLFENYADLSATIKANIKEYSLAAIESKLITVNEVLALGIKEGWILPMAGLDHQWAIVESVTLSQKRLEAYVTGTYPVEEFWHRSYANLLNEVVSPLRIRLIEQTERIEELEVEIKELKANKPKPPSFGQIVHRGIDPKGVISATSTGPMIIPPPSPKDDYYGPTQSDNYGSAHQENNYHDGASRHNF